MVFLVYWQQFIDQQPLSFLTAYVLKYNTAVVHVVRKACILWESLRIDHLIGKVVEIQAIGHFICMRSYVTLKQALNKLSNQSPIIDSSL